MNWTIRIAAAGIALNAVTAAALFMGTGGVSSFYLALTLGQVALIASDLNEGDPA